jgi:hypothetical protein
MALQNICRILFIESTESAEESTRELGHE